MDNSNLGGIELSVKEIIPILMKRIWWIIMSAVLCAIIAFVYSTYFVTPLYRSQVIFYINPLINQKEVSYNMEFQSNVYAKQLVNTYIEILKTNSFRQKIADNSERYSKGQINGSISFGVKEETQLFTVSVVSTSYEDCYEIAQIIKTAAPQTIIDVVGNNTLTVADEPIKSTAPINNNTNRNTFIGAFAGAFLAAVIVILLGVFDTRVKGEDDLRNHYDVPILGGIVNFNKIYKGKNH